MKASYFIVFCLGNLFALFAKGQILPGTNPTINNEIVFASDTQAPIWIEAFWLKLNRNRAATRKIFSNILQGKPRAVFILGDVVSVGSSNKQWKRMNVYLQQLRSKGIHVNAAMGNHDIMFKAKKGQHKFKEHFPGYAKTGHVQIVDSVAVILLNSNFKILSPNEDAAQVSWYCSTLQKLDQDPAIQFIITGCHHSPYSNSKAVGSSLHVQQKFVTSFLTSKKSQLFLSGHTHAFEHYKVQGKDFMVIGGGGGMQQPLKKSKDNLPDLAVDYKPLFHYLTVERQRDQLEVISLRLKPDFSAFEEGLKIYIKKAPDATKAVSDSLLTNFRGLQEFEQKHERAN